MIKPIVPGLLACAWPLLLPIPEIIYPFAMSVSWDFRFIESELLNQENIRFFILAGIIQVQQYFD